MQISKYRFERRVCDVVQWVGRVWIKSLSCLIKAWKMSQKSTEFSSAKVFALFDVGALHSLSIRAVRSMTKHRKARLNVIRKQLCSSQPFCTVDEPLFLSSAVWYRRKMGFSCWFQSYELREWRHSVLRVTALLCVCVGAWEIVIIAKWMNNKINSSSLPSHELRHDPQILSPCFHIENSPSVFVALHAQLIWKINFNCLMRKILCVFVWLENEMNEYVGESCVCALEFFIALPLKDVLEEKLLFKEFARCYH